MGCGDRRSAPYGVGVSNDVLDVTDATFETDVIARSDQTPVVIDLWAPWCGPCRQLTPILEKVISATEGKVALVKVNVDDNPGVSQAFQVQGIPAVYAMKDRKVVDGFVGAKGEADVTAFVEQLLPSEEQSEIDQLLAIGDEQSLRQVLELDPPNGRAIAALAELLVGEGKTDEALDLLNRIPESAETRRIAALARTGDVLGDVDTEAKLAELLVDVRDDEAKRQEFVDLLELMGPDNPRTIHWRKQLTARLF